MLRQLVQQIIQVLSSPTYGLKYELVNFCLLTFIAFIIRLMSLQSKRPITMVPKSKRATKQQLVIFFYWKQAKISLFETAVTLGNIFPSSIVQAARMQVFFMRLSSQLRQPMTGPKNLGLYLSTVPTCQFPGRTWYNLFAIQLRNFVQQPRFFLGWYYLFKSKKSPLITPNPYIFSWDTPSPFLSFSAYHTQGILSIFLSDPFEYEILFIKNQTILASEGSNLNFYADLILICLVSGWKQQGLSLIRLSYFCCCYLRSGKISSKFLTYSCSICFCSLMELMSSRSCRMSRVVRPPPAITLSTYLQLIIIINQIKMLILSQIIQQKYLPFNYTYSKQQSVPSTINSQK